MVPYFAKQRNFVKTYFLTKKCSNLLYSLCLPTHQYKCTCRNQNCSCMCHCFDMEGHRYTHLHLRMKKYNLTHSISTSDVNRDLKKKYLPSLQSWFCQPNVQLQKYDPTVLIHVPLFWHGKNLHSSSSKSWLKYKVIFLVTHPKYEFHIVAIKAF